MQINALHLRQEINIEINKAGGKVEQQNDL
jgi:hypothetical protein